ncbi:hypothetical protein AcV5_000334 [Taiwanofungus camphoratus]|nr:hypothetical protein AcV5_000334 [Antrodia cinnamomea]
MTDGQVRSPRSSRVEWLCSQRVVTVSYYNRPRERTSFACFKLRFTAYLEHIDPNSSPNKQASKQRRKIDLSYNCFQCLCQRYRYIHVLTT